MKRNIDTVIQFSGLASGNYEYEYVLDGDFFSGFENEDLQEGTVNFSVKLEKRERMLLLNFSFQGEVKTICDRCLGEMAVPVEGEETLCVKFSDTETSEDENVVFLPEDEYQIDLAQWMYEYVVISLPIQKIHEEGHCDPEMLKFITSEGKNIDVADTERSADEIDPRWAALKSLMDTAPEDTKQSK